MTSYYQNSNNKSFHNEKRNIFHTKCENLLIHGNIPSMLLQLQNDSWGWFYREGEIHQNSLVCVSPGNIRRFQIIWSQQSFQNKSRKLLTAQTLPNKNPQSIWNPKYKKLMKLSNFDSKLSFPALGCQIGVTYAWQIGLWYFLKTK